MADKTKIEWTDATWNVITGCSVKSPGCANCYAMRLAGTRLRSHPTRKGLTIETKAGPVWNGEVRFNEGMLAQPLQWKRPRRIFVCAHADLFHENVPDEWIDRVFAVMALSPQHTFQVLTKRTARMQCYVNALVSGERSIWQAARAAGLNAARLAKLMSSLGWGRFAAIRAPLPNVWLGASVEDQARANERVPLLLSTPAAVRWLSMEPLLGPVILSEAWHGESALDSECWGECNWCRQGAEFPPLWNCQANRQTEADRDKMRSGLDWIVLGGESGPGARPMHPEWARLVRDECAAAGVPFHFKQWGDWSAVYDRDRDDPDWRLCDSIARRNESGRWLNLAGGQGFHGDRVVRVEPLGKRLAGRLLDGVQHDGMPHNTAILDGPWLEGPQR